MVSSLRRRLLQGGEMIRDIVRIAKIVLWIFAFGTFLPIWILVYFSRDDFPVEVEYAASLFSIGLLLLVGFLVGFGIATLFGLI